MRRADEGLLTPGERPSGVMTMCVIRCHDAVMTGTLASERGLGKPRQTTVDAIAAHQAPAEVGRQTSFTRRIPAHRTGVKGRNA